MTPVTPRHFCVAGVALGDIHLDFMWQAWHNLTSTVVLRGRRGTDGIGWRAWTGLGAAVTPVTPRHFCVAAVALGDIHLDFTWQAWHNLTSTVVLRGRRGTDGIGWRAWTGLGAAVTPVTPRHFCVAAVALGDIHLDFTWQAWHNLTSTVVLRGRRGTDGTGWRAWTGLGAAVTPVTPRHFCVAGVALGDIHLDFMWQAWHNLTSTVVLRGRRGTDGTHNLTSTVVLRGRRGTDGTGWRAWTGLGAAVTPVTPRHFCVAGVALGDIHLDFMWQAWHNLTSTVVLRGRRGTDGIGWRAWTGLGAAVTPVTPRHFCVAGVALGDIHLDFMWQAWHNLTSTVVLRGRRGTDGTGWRAWTGLGAAVTPVTPRRCLRGRRGTWRHGSPLCMAGVALMALGWLWWGAWFPVGAVDAAAVCVEGVALGDIERHFAWQAWHLATWTSTLRGKRGTSGTLRGRRGHLDFAWPAWHLVTSTSFVFPSFPVGMITSHKACRKSWQNLRLHSAEHYIQTYMHTYIHTIFSHTIFLCHTRSFTYNFAPRNSFNFSILHHLLCLSFLPRPATTFVAHGPHTHTPHTQLITTQFPHAQLTHTRVPCCTRQSFTISFLFPAFPMPSLTSFRACWKKLTCGVIRSFNLW